MSLKTLHANLGQLLEAGVDPNIPVVSLFDGWPCEVADVVGLTGKFHGDPSPKMSSFILREWTMLVLNPIGEDPSDLINKRSHSEDDLPVVKPDLNAKEKASCPLRESNFVRL